MKTLGNAMMGIGVVFIILVVIGSNSLGGGAFPVWPIILIGTVEGMILVTIGATAYTVGVIESQQDNLKERIIAIQKALGAKVKK